MLLDSSAFRQLPGTAGMLIGGVMSPFHWIEYVAGAAIYTLIVFAGQFSNGRIQIGPRVFSTRNTRPPLMIIGIHIVFLAVFLGSMWMVSSHLAQLPIWLTAKDLMNPGRHGGAQVTLLELLLAVVAVILRTVELPCVYAESNASGPVAYANPSSPSWMDSHR